MARDQANSNEKGSYGWSRERLKVNENDPDANQNQKAVEDHKAEKARAAHQQDKAVSKGERKALDRLPVPKKRNPSKILGNK